MTDIKTNLPSFIYSNSQPSFTPWTNLKFQSMVQHVVEKNSDIVSGSINVPSFNSIFWLNLSNEELKQYSTLTISYQYQDETNKYYILSSNNEPNVIVFEGADGSYINEEYGYYETNSIKNDVTFNKVWIFGLKDNVNIINNMLKEKLKTSSINSNQYRADLLIADSHSQNIRTTKLLSGSLLVKEAYPYLKDIENQIDSFLNSSQSIMLMQGPPGTGKTTLIKYIASKMLGGQVDKRALLVNIASDSENMTAAQFKNVVTDLIKPYNSLIVFEDSDSIIQSRKSGNSAITPIFTLVDGMFAVNNKWIFTTNLEDTKKIDAALLRPGRCHSYIKTRALSIDELKILAQKSNLSHLIDKITKPLTLAEFFHLSENREFGYLTDGGATGSTKMGFN